MSRRHLALLAVLVLVGLAGCTGLFGAEEVDPSQLNQNASYDWDSEANATIQINKSSYAAVYQLRDNRTFTVFTRDELGREQNVPIRALRFRYPNGTVVSPANSSLSANRTGQQTTIRLPGDGTGQVAYTAPRSGKSFANPTYLNGQTYAVTLPPGARVGIPLLSQVTPGGYETSVDESTDRMTVRWSEPVTAGAVRLRYYLERDLYIFGGLALVAVVVGTVGTAYYWRQLQEVKRRREEAGIDIEMDDDDDPRDRGPPPGQP
jgi:hypothetical protein